MITIFIMYCYWTVIVIVTDDWIQKRLHNSQHDWYNKDLFEASIEDLQFFARKLGGSAERLESLRFVSGHATVGILQVSAYNQHNVVLSLVFFAATCFIIWFIVAS